MSVDRAYFTVGATASRPSPTAAPLTGNPNASNQLVTGDVFAVRTTEGRFVKVQVVQYGYDFQAVLRVTLDTDTHRTARKRYGTSALFTASPRTLLLKALEPGASFPADLYLHEPENLCGAVQLGVRIDQGVKRLKFPDQFGQ
ncbi:hypothetical protein ACIBO9_11900 [Streptomyces prunicolor]|jgi:hypothetical protein|uniref:hypothetical protein n=1 Tax=Streptomyces prunicolor TaxID=67348 RepID=UPI0037CD0093